MKKCKTCNELKPKTEFYKISGKHYVFPECKKCANLRHTLWCKNNRKRLNEFKRIWRRKNKEKVKECAKRSDQKCFLRVRAQNKKYRENHPDRIKLYWQRAHAKFVSTPFGRITARMRAGLANSLKQKKKGRHWETLVGYTVEDLYKHLESKFTDGMSWENMGEWHIDHIVPVSRFKYNNTDDPEFKVCWGLNNLQPFWAKDNLSKLNKTPQEWVEWKSGIKGLNNEN